MLPFVLALLKANKYFYFVLSLSVFLLVYINFLEPKLYGFNENYIEKSYSSDGAFVRVIMLVIPSLIFLKYSKYIEDNDYLRQYFKLISYASIGLLALLFLVPSSTVIDRLALYFIPIQLLVYPNLNRIPISINNHKLPLTIIIIYSFLVLIYWVIFSNHSNYWLPYNNFLTQ